MSICMHLCLFLAVVVCIGSVIILLRELVSVAPQYVLEVGHTMCEWLVGHVRLLLATLVGLGLILVLFLLLWLLIALHCPLVVVHLGVMLKLGTGVGLLRLGATQAAVGVIFGVAVRVGRLQDSISGAVSVQMWLVGFGDIRDAAVNSRAWLVLLHGVAFTVVANEAVIALLGFTWGSQRVALLLDRLFIVGIGKGVLLPGVGRTPAVHGSCCLMDCRVRVVGVGLWSSLHAWSIRVIHLSLGHESAQEGIRVTGWRRSWGASLAVHSIGISNSVSISISIPKHGVGVNVLLSSRRSNTKGSSLIFFLAFVSFRGSGKSGGSKGVAAFFKKRVTGSRSSRGRGVRGTGCLEEHIPEETP